MSDENKKSASYMCMTHPNSHFFFFFYYNYSAVVVFSAVVSTTGVSVVFFFFFSTSATGASALLPHDAKEIAAIATNIKTNFFIFFAF